MTILNKNIKKLRKGRKLTQDMLGKILGVSGSAVSQWEAEKDPTMPDIKYLYSFTCIALNYICFKVLYNG